MWRIALFGSLLAVGCTRKDDDDDDDDGVDDTGADGDTGTGDTGEGTEGDGDVVEMVTSAGTVVITLDLAAAPVTTENFLASVDSGLYDGADGGGATVFHRVVDGFVVQGGGFTPEGLQELTEDPIPLESDNGLSNLRGTLGMARTSLPDSATSQFCFNLVDNTFLDYAGESGPGYAVFGRITEGLEVRDAMGEVETDSSDHPLDDIVIESVTVR